jgi:hypothetical protein
MGGNATNWRAVQQNDRMRQHGVETASGKMELGTGSRLEKETMLVNRARGGVSARLLEWLANPEPPLPDPVDAATPPRSEWHLAVLGAYEPTADYYRGT